MVTLLLVASIVMAVALCVALFVFARASRGSETNQAPDRVKAGSVRPLSSDTLRRLREWYAGRSCAICQRPIAPIHGEPRPGLLDTKAHQTSSWQDFTPDQLIAALETHLPVCADCHTASQFRRQFPDLIVDREPTPYRDSAFH
ncbi:MAG TPA: hypothetical protein VD833_03045 [Vicinamibacterales bacterium]|nr:hypothetical protein [Vicinamibacterales bacterium]